MESERQRLTSEEWTNLVAYLDGELGQDESSQVASTLSRSPIARRESESLRRTWQLLELLESPQASSEFTTRTLTLAGGEAPIEDRLVRLVSRYASPAGRLVVLCLLAAVLFLVGFATTRWAWPDRTARLARDLTIAEHLDAYQAVGSYEFLKQLDESSAIDHLAD